MWTAKILTGKLKWDVNANISLNKNKVIKLYNGEDILGGSVSVVALQDNATILREGRPIGQFWGYLENGYDDKGNIKYQDLLLITNKPPPTKLISVIRTLILFMDFNSTLSYKNFELDIFLQGVSWKQFI